MTVQRNEIRKIVLFAFLISEVLLFFSGCERGVGYQKVDFSKTLPASLEPAPHAQKQELRVAVAAMISPKETFIFYKQLLDHIGDRLGYRVQLIQRKTYKEVNALFPRRQIDLAFICTGPYAAAQEVYGFEAIATPIVRGVPFYQSYLIVNKRSPHQTLEDLRGRVFAFTDPDSNTGHSSPALLAFPGRRDTGQFLPGHQVYLQPRQFNPRRGKRPRGCRGGGRTQMGILPRPEPQLHFPNPGDPEVQAFRKPPSRGLIVSSRDPEKPDP